ncbi:MAG TPA: hypothetical protein VE956_13625 [Nodularia sp. (in: cyanobacteria)]|nr:hypothetical protein [Nodularia sp. (in: cyanobacteria)]
MATQSLKRDFFVFRRETVDDAGRVIVDPVGYFSCRSNVTRFLDLNQFVIRGNIKKQIESKVRDFTIVDSGANSYAVSPENTNAVANERTYTFRKYRTGKSIRIITGLKTTNKNPRTIGFLFPRWADITSISDALGTIIPPGKMSITPGTTEIFPEFSLKGGGTYAIALNAAAQASSTAEVALNPQMVIQLAARLGAVYLQGAGT